MSSGELFHKNLSPRHYWVGTFTCKNIAFMSGVRAVWCFWIWKWFLQNSAVIQVRSGACHSTTLPCTSLLRTCLTFPKLIKSGWSGTCHCLSFLIHQVRSHPICLYTHSANPPCMFLPILAGETHLSATFALVSRVANVPQNFLPNNRIVFCPR